MAPPDDLVIAVDNLLDIKTDEVMWSLFADTLQSIEESLEFSDVSDHTDGIFTSLAEDVFRTEFKKARDAITGALGDSVALSRSLEQALADAYVQFGNADAQAIATMTALWQTVQWHGESKTTVPVPMGSLTIDSDWREKMDADGGYHQ